MIDKTDEQAIYLAMGEAMSRYHQFTLPATQDGHDVLGSYGQLLCSVGSNEFAEQIVNALNATDERAELKRKNAVLMAAVGRIADKDSDIYTLAVLVTEAHPEGVRSYRDPNLAMALCRGIAQAAIEECK